ncbi:unnamed protein product [Effrenium voratum]|nr:unnamed protein product [Effrenium voratum]
MLLLIIVCVFSYLLYIALGRFLERRVAQKRLGDQRRTLYPPEVGITPGAQQLSEDADVELKKELHRIRDGTQIFFHILRPKKQAPTHALVFLHGYSSNGDLYLEFLADLARSGILVLVPDLPCHGRSDGLLLYISDWWAWVEQVWTALELVLPLECIVDGGMLPIFLAGNSLGGGLAACLALQRPSFFRGVILICPMLTISDEVKPPWIVQMTFKHVIAPLFPTLPVTPVKDMADFDFRDPAQGRSYVKASPFSLQGLTPRLGTSMQLGFIFPEWLDEHLSQVRTPFLIQHSPEDRITDPKTSQRLFDEAIAKDKTIKFYDGAYHCELFCCLPGNATFIGIPWTPEQE